MATERNIGSGIDQPKKAGLADRVREKVKDTTDLKPQKAGEDTDTAKKRRIEQEKTAFDLNHKPTERDAQIDGSGARFETDG
jgi:hypothetical protein